jgi:hypothetical protein
MRALLSILLTGLLAGLTSCSEMDGPPAGPDPIPGTDHKDSGADHRKRIYANAYFPLQVGNEWRYRVNTYDSLWVVKRVVDSAWVGSSMVFELSETWWTGDSYPSLFSVDSNGVVRAHENLADSVGSIYLRTDTERGVEWATLTYIRDRYAQETVPAGTLGPCVQVQRWRGEPQYEVYAENVGEIRRSAFGGRSLRLVSATIGGTSYP